MCVTVCVTLILSLLADKPWDIQRDDGDRGVVQELPAGFDPTKHCRYCAVARFKNSGYKNLRKKLRMCSAAQFADVHLTSTTVQQESFFKEHSDLRNELYYLFATRVQGFRGWQNQATIPVCVKRLIRRLFPDRFFKQADGTVVCDDTYDN